MNEQGFAASIFSLTRKIRRLPLAACRLPLAVLHVEHVIPKKHGGGDELDNLALACIDCNLHKGPNLTGLDPETGEITPMFNPRNQVWSEHFEWQGVLIIGLTAGGRTTIGVMEMNSEDQLGLRLS